MAAQIAAQKAKSLAIAKDCTSPRRQFLNLSAPERRRLLRAQAQAARNYYEKSSEWREWEAANLTGSDE